MALYLGLVHFPIYNKNAEIITTAVTNFDIHDLARTARTYGIVKYFLIHPLESQRNLAEGIIDYWQNGYGGEYNPDRKEALSILRVVPDIAGAISAVELETGLRPLVATTDARRFENSISYKKMREIIQTGGRPCLLLFGTGWGLEKGVMREFDYILEPILGSGEYNHLAVRAAAAIILDRLVGEEWYK